MTQSNSQPIRCLGMDLAFLIKKSLKFSDGRRTHSSNIISTLKGRFDTSIVHCHESLKAVDKFACNLFIQPKGISGRKVHDCLVFANVCVSSHSHCTSLETFGTILLLRSLLPT